MATFSPTTVFERSTDITPERLNALVDEIGRIAAKVSDNAKAANGSQITISVPGTSGVTDHGVLTGLTDDDHTQYLLRTDAATDYAPAHKYLIYYDRKSTGQNGGDLNAGWNERALNTVQANNASPDITVSGSQITLAAGTYYIKASAPASMVGLHKLKVMDVGSSLTLLLGTSEWSGAISTRSFAEGVITVATATTISIYHYAQSTVLSTGAGAAVDSGEYEMYTTITIFKLA